MLESDTRGDDETKQLNKFEKKAMISKYLVPWWCFSSILGANKCMKNELFDGMMMKLRALIKLRKCWSEGLVVMMGGIYSD